MTFFYERLAKRILEGTSGLTGHEVTSETERCAGDLREALKPLGIASVVVQAGKQFKVRLSTPSGTETGNRPFGAKSLVAQRSLTKGSDPLARSDAANPPRLPRRQTFLKHREETMKIHAVVAFAGLAISFVLLIFAQQKDTVDPQTAQQVHASQGRDGNVVPFHIEILDRGPWL